MKKVSSVILIAAVCIIQSCGSGTENKDSTDSAKSVNSDRDTSSMTSSDTNKTNANTGTGLPVDKDVADFAVKAASGGMMEVELGKLAQQKAVSQRVKDFGAMMEKDHSQAGDELKKLAASKNIAIPGTPDDDTKKKIDDFSKKSGKDFDTDYMNMMLDDHKKDIKEFQKAGADLKDADVKAFALKTLPTLQKHLDSAIAITGKK